MKKLEAHEVPLVKVFSSDDEFAIPNYQRPYTGTEQATQLLDDLYRAVDRNPDEPYWTHRLANMVLLSRNKNAQTTNYDFAVKKLKYVTSRAGVSNFPLTTQVLATEKWTPELLAQGKRDLIDTLSEAWDLTG